ncbi:phosphate acyltransferase [Candidatus Epulonipiscium fishelsonii]|uniref:Phosphate acyltransferase n=1 Tax=Candidatus Epulonipiscium fishelsonii TaxID=77094 RepID=A0ACC8XDP3_9FIRM|nr:phosphate acyltransferase [Epulopiscium sp. SCG-B05WGA-EpuloA1]ONI41054.1 phosphate acyltransferase [Epulopiscium sp. SCG-B11WGA-EpuloA1]
MKIAVDVMSGDNAPAEIIKGCIKALETCSAKLILVGQKPLIKQELQKYKYNKNMIEIVDCKEVITMEDSPVNAIRTKKDSSMVVGLNLVKNKEADGFVSAGNTGALLSGGTLLVGRIKGVQRPALPVLLPTKKGYTLLIDCGANMDSKASYLQQFAHIGTIYMQEFMDIKKPKVGLINVGVEEEKGNSLTKETFALLKEDKKIRFIGNIEAREISNGKADILVCDAFVGNVVLKFMEGFGSWIFSILKTEFKRSLKTKIAALIMKDGINNLKNKFYYSDKGGAPLLGIKGIVIKTHGNAKEAEICSTILQAESFAKNELIEKLTKNFQ